MTPPRVEWRMGWWWSGRVGVDWYDWGVGAHVGVKWGVQVGGDFQFGPLYGYWGWEVGSELFEDGKRAGLGVGPV